MFEQLVGLIEEGDVGRVAHFADVLPQEGAREGGLARIGVRDETERNDVRCWWLDARGRRHGVTLESVASAQGWKAK